MKRDTRGPRSLGSSLGKLGPATHAIRRIGAGLLFLEHGAQKLFGVMGGRWCRPCR